MSKLCTNKDRLKESSSNSFVIILWFWGESVLMVCQLWWAYWFFNYLLSYTQHFILTMFLRGSNTAKISHICFSLSCLKSKSGVLCKNKNETVDHLFLYCACIRSLCNKVSLATHTPLPLLINLISHFS